MHPYDDFADHNFWRRGVADHLWTDIEFVPSVPFTLSRADRIGTGGSCFAQHIARALAPLGLTYYVTEQAPSIRVQVPQRATAARIHGRFESAT